MTVIPAAQRAEVEPLAGKLLELGFELSYERYDDKSFGNALLEFKHDQAIIRLVRDRSIWAIEIADPSHTDWFMPAVWRAYFDGQAPPFQAQSFEEQSELLVRLLPKVERVGVQSGGDVLGKLSALRAERGDWFIQRPVPSGK